MEIASSAVVHPEVQLGEGCVVEAFCLIGSPSRSGERRSTVIGAGSVLRSHTVVYAGCVIGERFQSGNKLNIRENTRIGADVSIGSLSIVEHHVHIEDAVRIHSGVFIPEYTRIESFAWIGPGCVLTNSKYPASRTAKNNLESPILEEGCRIGANVTILPGVRIGKGAVIGAGSVVTKDVPAGMLAYGSPAAVQKSVGEVDEYRP